MAGLQRWQLKKLSSVRIPLSSLIGVDNWESEMFSNRSAFLAHLLRDLTSVVLVASSTEEKRIGEEMMKMVPAVEGKSFFYTIELVE